MYFLRSFFSCGLAVAAFACSWPVVFGGLLLGYVPSSWFVFVGCCFPTFCRDYQCWELVSSSLVALCGAKSCSF